MGPFELSKDVQSDPRFAQKTLEEKVQIRQYLLGEMKYTSEYQGMAAEDRASFDREYMASSMPGLDMASLVNGDEEDARSAQFLNQAQTAIDMGKADINFGEGFVETSTNFVSGKLGAWAVDLFTEEDTTKRLFGDRSDEYRRYRDYVLETMDPEGITDWKIGKAAGNILGFAADAYVSASLYGGVGAAGLLTKGVGKIGMQTAGKTALTYLAQFGIEGAGYVVEEAIADAITGELNSNTQFADYMATVPGDFGKGIIMSMFGEALGIAAGGAMKGMGRTFTPNGFGASRVKNLQKEDIPTLFQGILDGAQGKLTPEFRSAMKAGGFSKDAQRKILNSFEDTKMALDPTNFRKDPDAFKQSMFKAAWGMDTVVKGDFVTIKTFGGQVVDPPRVSQTMGEFHANMKELSTDFDNDKFLSMSKLKSNKDGTLNLQAIGRESTQKIAMNADSTAKVFRPGITGEVNTAEVEALYKQLTAAENVKIVPVENYFSVKRPVAGLDADGNMLITVPKNVDSADQAVRFSKDFFTQVKSFSKIEYDAKQLEGLLRSTGNLKHDLSTLQYFYKGNQYKLKPGGQVDVHIREGKDGWQAYESVEQAARDAHIRSMSEDSLNSYYATTKGLHLFKEGDGRVSLKDSKGKVVVTKENVEELYADDLYRPPLAEAMKPQFKAFAPIPGETKMTIKNTSKDQTLQTYEVIKKNAKKFAKNPEETFVKEFAKQGTMIADPKFMTYRVQMGENGLRKDFSSFTEAQKWLNKGMKTFNDLEGEAWERGVRLEPFNGGYSVESAMLPRKFFKELDDAQAYIATQSDILDSRELIEGMTNADLRLVAKNLEDAVKVVHGLDTKQTEKAAKYRGEGRSRLEKGADKLFTPITERFSQIGDQYAMRLNRQTTAADNMFHAEYGDFKKKLTALFHNKNGDSSVQDLRNMYNILKVEQNASSWQKTADDAGIELTQDMKSKMKAVRGIFDTYGARFGIDFKMWVDDYLPRISDPKAPGRMNKREDFDALIKKKAPTKLDPFFKHLRIEDHIQTAFQDNLEGILDTYVRTGLKTVHFEDVINASRKYIKGNTGSEEAKRLLHIQNEQSIGRVYSSEKATQVRNKYEHNKFKADKILAGEGKYREMTDDERALRALKTMNQPDPAEFLSDAITASLMTGKFKMPIRNLSQTLTTSAPVIGFQYVKEGWKFLGSDISEVAKFTEEMTNAGILTGRLPMGKDYNNIAKFLKRANEVGLHNYFAADDFNRLATAFGTRARFRDGIEMVKRGQMDTNGLLRYSKMNWQDAAEQARFVKLVTDGDLRSAELLVMKRTTDMTQFNYSLTDRPEGMTNGVGKIFGKFGTFSSQYAQFMKRGLKAEGVGFATKVVIGTYAVSRFYSDVLNIDHISPTPWDTMAFTGSPFIGSTVSIYDDARNGRITAGSAFNDMSIAFPFYGLGKSMVKGFHEIAEGNLQDGFTRMLGATPPEERKFPQDLEKITNF